jgi:aspartate racemase
MSMEEREGSPVVGILGGMGPSAGLDLASKLISETSAARDQEHVPFVLFSRPTRIEDRTAFLLGNATVNPGIEIARQIVAMEETGVTVAGMACNTAHAPPIFDDVIRRLTTNRTALKPLHLIQETTEFIQRHWPSVRRVGILGTPGTLRFRIYDEPLAAMGLEPVQPERAFIDGPLRDAVYHPRWGIKARAHPVSSRARQALVESIEHLLALGAEAVVLGCTELPLAVPEDAFDDRPLIDPARVLARALIRDSYPERLKPWRAGETPSP